MAWIALIAAGLLEIVWAFFMKQSEGFTRAAPTVIMLVGLQGSGKTTQAGKLALRLKEQGRRSLLVAADVQRPAAIAQLQTLGKQIDLPVYDEGAGDPVKIAQHGVAPATGKMCHLVAVDENLAGFRLENSEYAFDHD